MNIQTPVCFKIKCFGYILCRFKTLINICLSSKMPDPRSTDSQKSNSNRRACRQIKFLSQYLHDVIHISGFNKIQSRNTYMTCQNKTLKEIMMEIKTIHTSNVPSRLRVGGVIASARKNGIKTLCICIQTRKIRQDPPSHHHRIR